MEFVVDKESKKPFEAELGLNKVIKRCAVETDLMCYPLGGTLDGKQGDHVLLAPPFIVDKGDVDMIVERLEIAISLALKEVGAA